ncbi:MAG: hypothetical protein LBS70_07705 [Candidatus Accumulibacter sp.]|jgi:hypothetical protein|nr:hypothetical protein [Accumulibacter sp.]
MKALFWVLALFALAVGVSLGLRYNEGYVLIVLPATRVEVSLNFAILLAIFGFFVLYGLLRALFLALALPRRVRESRARRRNDKAARGFAESVRLYLADERRKAIDAVAGLRGEGAWSAPAALLAARAAGELGDEAARKKWLARAAEFDPKLAPPPGEEDKPAPPGEEAPPPGEKAELPAPADAPELAPPTAEGELDLTPPPGEADALPPPGEDAENGTAPV